MRAILTYCSLAAFGLAFSAAPSFASAEVTVEGAKLCTRNISRYERQYGIPAHLLSAIAATESGRYYEPLRIALPWPWTINAEGQGYYYASKAEAVQAARKFQARGMKSIDVGCMQVNLFHHPDAFANLEQAFDPERNVAYSASFLRNLYEENKSWKVAASYYHSRTQWRGREYVGKVYDRWYTIVQRLRAVKVDIPETTLAALDNREMPAKPVRLVGMKDAKEGDAVQDAKIAETKVVNVKPKVVTPLPEQRGRKIAAYKSPKMNSISVKNASHTQENGVLVIRPKITVVDNAPETLTIVQATPVSQQVAANYVTPVAQDAQSARNVDDIIARSGPRFIFEN